MGIIHPLPPNWNRVKTIGQRIVWLQCKMIPKIRKFFIWYQTWRKLSTVFTNISQWSSKYFPGVTVISHQVGINQCSSGQENLRRFAIAKDYHTVVMYYSMTTLVEHSVAQCTVAQIKEGRFCKYTSVFLIWLALEGSQIISI